MVWESEPAATDEIEAQRLKPRAAAAAAAGESTIDIYRLCQAYRYDAAAAAADDDYDAHHRPWSLCVPLAGRLRPLRCIPLSTACILCYHKRRPKLYGSQSIGSPAAAWLGSRAAVHWRRNQDHDGDRFRAGADLERAQIRTILL